MLLGLDLSTTVCGFCILNVNGEIIKIGYHSFNKDNNLVNRGNELDTLLDELLSKYNITECCIEERLKAFKAGGTNAEAMLKTCSMNFLCQYLLNKKGISVTELNVNTARKAVFPTFHKFAKTVKNMRHKEIIFKFVIDKLGENIFPKKILKSGINKGKKVFLEEAKDMADSYVIAMADFKMKNEKSNMPAL